MGGGNIKVAVVGAGAWGSALAFLLARKGYDIVVYSFEKEVADDINLNRHNVKYLNGFVFPDNVVATNSFSDLDGCDIFINATPVQYTRGLWERISSYLKGKVKIVNASKGIEVLKGERVSEIMEEIFGDDLVYAVLSGPSFAVEVARGLPTAVSLAGEDEDFLLFVQRMFSSDRFRVYVNKDVVGVEIAGALKNVIAIAAGVSDGLGLGDNARASLINRGLVEIAKFGISFGASPITFIGLAGMGDLVLTCTGDKSRNRRVGLALGGGKGLDEALENAGGVAEGVETVKAVVKMALDRNIDMPISSEVYSILFEGKDINSAVRSLMDRELKFEFYWFRQ